jgi:integrase
MSPRTRHHGVRKVCDCGWKQWPKCAHAWYFTYKPRRGPRYRFSLDRELGRHIDSKTEAQNAAADIRSAINAGTFRRAVDAPLPATTTATDVVTLDAFATTYIERAVQPSGKTSWKDDEYLLAALRNYIARDRRRLGDWALNAITEDELEAFHAHQRSRGRAASTLNHQIQIITAAFRWAAKKGYLPRSPLSEDSALKRTKVAQRRRRVHALEEAAILKTAEELTRQSAGHRLQWLILAALETGARLGELLALTWADVSLEKHTVLIRATETGARKTGRSRKLPMSSRLAAALEMAKLDPAGRRFKATAYVFGAFGERIHSVDRAWQTAVLRAHGHEPLWTPTGALAEESRNAFQVIDLHFHDLRHEAGCRWLEGGWPIHHVREMLGHANLSQTSTYLHASERGLEESMQRFDAARGQSVAKTDAIDERPLGHESAEHAEKEPLH